MSVYINVHTHTHKCCGKCFSSKAYITRLIRKIYDLQVKEKEGQQRCWDTLGQSAGGGAIGVYYCHSGGGNQVASALDCMINNNDNNNIAWFVSWLHWQGKFFHLEEISH